MILTVIIRDEEPFIHLQEPCRYRTVHIELTEEQVSALRTNGDEQVGQCFIEPERGDK